TTVAETPAAAPRPAAPNAQAATPSRGPQPAMLSGTLIASSTSTPSGTSCDKGAVVPEVRAARTKVAVLPTTTNVEATRTPGHTDRASSTSRTSASVVRRARAPRVGPAWGRARASSTTTTTTTTATP